MAPVQIKLDSKDSRRSLFVTIPSNLSDELGLRVCLSFGEN